MKDIKTSWFITELSKTVSNMYRLGWDERNGGNISCLLYEEDIKEYIDVNNVIREIPLGFEAKQLSGKYFLVTGTGKYFKNIEIDPENNLGILRIKDDGCAGQLLWGYKDGGKFTSEFPAHLMSHIEKLNISNKHRVVLHTHPLAIMAMSFVHPLSDRDFTRTIWKMNNECIVVFPDGIGVIPWMVCGTNQIGEATAEKMKKYRIVLWPNHGIYATGNDLDEAFGLVETVEKAAQVYMMIGDKKIINPITDQNLKDLALNFNLDYRKDFLDI